MEGVPVHGRGMEWEDLEGPFQFKPSMTLSSSRWSCLHLKHQNPVVKVEEKKKIPIFSSLGQFVSFSLKKLQIKCTVPLSIVVQPTSYSGTINLIFSFWSWGLPGSFLSLERGVCRWDEDAEQKGEDVHTYLVPHSAAVWWSLPGRSSWFSADSLPRVKCRTLLMNIHCHHCLFAELNSQFPEECAHP